MLVRNNCTKLLSGSRVDTVSSIPLGRAGKTEEIAGVRLMLASNYCSFVSGQTIVVIDGGGTIG